MAPEPQRATLLKLLNGYQVTQAIHVAAVLGIADVLQQGGRSADDLAGETGTDPRTLYRLLRALAAVGVFREEGDRTFALTPVGEKLIADRPGSLRDYAIFIGHESNWITWGSLLDGVRTGSNVFRQVYGKSVWEYRAARPELSALFTRATAQTKLAGSVLDICDFSGFGTIVDVGGGTGAMLAGILAAHPQAKGVLFDQPHVVANNRLSETGVADRCRAVGGDFFAGVPEGGDAYILRAVLHDWEDEDCVAILKSCRKAVSDTARLFLVERLVGPPNDDAETKFFDLTMLVNPGGRERTREEYGRLLEAAGFLPGPVAGPGPDRFYVFEATPDS